MSEAKDGGEGKEEKAPDLSWLPEGTTPLADGDYGKPAPLPLAPPASNSPPPPRADAIVMGTGLKECILSGLLSVMGMRILHVDRNNYYGGESASVNLTNLYQKFHDGQDPPKEFTDALGHNRDYNVDLVPKMIMACGKLVKMLLHTKVTRYLEFKSIDGSYVYRKGKPYKVPVTKQVCGAAHCCALPCALPRPLPSPLPPIQDVVTSSLVGFFEKRRMISFLMFVQKWDKDKPATHAGYVEEAVLLLLLLLLLVLLPPLLLLHARPATATTATTTHQLTHRTSRYDLNVMTTNELYNAYSLDASTRQFVGHAMALEPDESYLNRPAIRAVEAIRLYCYSLDLYGTSPYLYPLYGLGGLPEGFSRLCAINGGTFMLNTGIEEVLFNEEGVAWGVRGGEGGKQVAKAKMIIGDPSYVQRRPLLAAAAAAAALACGRRYCCRCCSYYHDHSHDRYYYHHYQPRSPRSPPLSGTSPTTRPSSWGVWCGPSISSTTRCRSRPSSSRRSSSSRPPRSGARTTSTAAWCPTRTRSARPASTWPSAPPRPRRPTPRLSSSTPTLSWARSCTASWMCPTSRRPSPTARPTVASSPSRTTPRATLSPPASTSLTCTSASPASRPTTSSR